jgi:hypothetical protein
MSCDIVVTPRLEGEHALRLLQRCHDDHVIAELLDTLTHTIPKLDCAACRGRTALFDVADRQTAPSDRQGQRTIVDEPITALQAREVAADPYRGRPMSLRVRSNASGAAEN